MHDCWSMMIAAGWCYTVMRIENILELMMMLDVGNEDSDDNDDDDDNW
jgi:hypothetical protein